MDYIKMGQRIREKRISADMTQEQVAEIVELSSVYIGQIERGERKLSLETLIKISNCLNVSVESLIRDSVTVMNTDAKINELKTILKDCSYNELDLITDIAKTVLLHTKERV